MNDLGRIFTKHGTDKAELHYDKPYKKYLPKEAGHFLEIGTWLGGGIRSFREWYKNQGIFYTLNYRFGSEFELDIPPKHSLESEGFICLEGQQQDINFLNTIDQKFNVIIDDGSHHSDDQIITFKHLFKNNLLNGGLYVLEDLHCCFQDFFWVSVEGFENTFVARAMEVKKGGDWTSQLFSKEDNEYLKDNISKLVLAGDRNESIAFIWKK